MRLARRKNQEKKLSCHSLNIVRMESGQTILQVIHIRRNHWAAIQFINDAEIMLFDSSFDSFNDDTFDTIAKLVYSSKDT